MTNNENINQINISKGLIPILPVKRGQYFYVARHVTETDRLEHPKKFPINIKYVMIVNTAFSSFEKCAKEVACIINRERLYCMFQPSPEDIELQRLGGEFEKNTKKED